MIIVFGAVDGTGESKEHNDERTERGN
jgi:hypothetical protein